MWHFYSNQIALWKSNVYNSDFVPITLFAWSLENFIPDGWNEASKEYHAQNRYSL